MKAGIVWTVYFGTIDADRGGDVIADRDDNVCVVAPSLADAIPLAVKTWRRLGMEKNMVPVRARYDLRVDA